MTFFPEKISIFTPKISYDLFLVIDQILRFFTVLNHVYNLFFTRKTTISEKNSLIRPFFTLFVLTRASDNTTFLNIGGPMHGPSPTSNFWGDRPPSPPRSPPLTTRNMSRGRSPGGNYREEITGGNYRGVHLLLVYCISLVLPGV